jgi:hypothetical protein
MGSPDPDPPRGPAEVCFGMPSVVSRAASELPDIDDHLVEPETRYEMYDGELVLNQALPKSHAGRGGWDADPRSRGGDSESWTT